MPGSESDTPRRPATAVDRRGVAGSAPSSTLSPSTNPWGLPRLVDVARSESEGPSLITEANPVNGAGTFVNHGAFPNR